MVTRALPVVLDGSRYVCLLEREGERYEIVATIAFLASPGGGYITGQNIRVDGGITRAV